MVGAPPVRGPATGAGTPGTGPPVVGAGAGDGPVGFVGPGVVGPGVVGAGVTGTRDEGRGGVTSPGPPHMGGGSTAGHWAWATTPNRPTATTATTARATTTPGPNSFMNPPRCDSRCGKTRGLFPLTAKVAVHVDFFAEPQCRNRSIRRLATQRAPVGHSQGWALSSSPTNSHGRCRSCRRRSPRQYSHMRVGRPPSTSEAVMRRCIWSRHYTKPALCRTG